MVEESDNADNSGTSSWHGQQQPNVELRHTQSRGFCSYRAEQWNQVARDGNVMFPWHTFCLVVDLVTAAVLFVYGWIRSSAPWPYLIPAVGYVVVDMGLVAVFVALGPLPVMSSPVHKVLGPIQGSQQVFCTLVAVFVPLQQVCVPTVLLQYNAVPISVRFNCRRNRHL